MHDPQPHKLLLPRDKNWQTSSCQNWIPVIESEEKSTMVQLNFTASRGQSMPSLGVMIGTAELLS